MDTFIFRQLEALALPKHTSVPNKGAEEHLKLLYAIIAARFIGATAVTKQKGNLTQWYNGASEYLKSLGLSRKPYRVLIKLLESGKIKGNTFDDQIDILTNELRPIMKIIRGNTKLTDDEITAYNSGYRILNRPSERALNLAIKSVGLLKSTTHNQWFAEKIEGQKDILEELTHIVKKLIKKDKPTLTIDEAKQAKEKFPKQYKQYLQIRRKATNLYRQGLRALVRQAGKNNIDAQTAAKQLEAAGISLHGIPKGFKGLVDEAGKLYTSEGRRLKQQPPPNAKITMNPNYDSKTGDGYYLKYSIPGAIGKPQFAYTVDWEHKQVKNRDKKVMNLAKEVSQARKKWLTDIKSKDRETRMLGIMVELLYTFQIRAGSAKSATGGERTYGLTTLKGEHLRTRGSNLVIQYPGKSGVPQKHQIIGRDQTNKLIIKRLLKSKKRAGDDGYIFTDDHKKRIASRALNRYIRSKGLQVTAKDFRRLQGKVLMEEYFSKNKLAKDATQTQVTAYLKAGALEVGKALGHRRGVKTGAKDEAQFTSATAIGSYIPPGILKDLYKERGLRVPKFLANKFGSD